LPLRRPVLDHYDKVVYPLGPIKTHLFTTAELERLCHQYLKRLTYTEKKEKKMVPFKGEWINLPCIQNLRSGIKEGKRHIGARILNVAARLDKLPSTDIIEILKEYVHNCPQQESSFTLSEAGAWKEWFEKKKDKPYWNCGTCINLGVCEMGRCPYNQLKYKKEIELLKSEKLLDHVKSLLDKTVVGEDDLKMQLFLAYITIQLPGPVEWCILIESPASSGKSHTMKAVARLFGKEGERWISRSRLTGASLDYLQDEWKDKIVIIEEIQGADKAAENLRVAISEGRVSLQSTEEINGKRVSCTKVADFSSVLFVTCNAEDIDNGSQLLSRAFVLNTDTSDIQTENIIEGFLQSKEKDSLGSEETDILPLLNILKKPDGIIIPFARELKDFIPKNKLRARRDVKKICALISSSAFIHQYQREWKDNYLVASWKDVYYVYKYAGETLDTGYDSVNPDEKKFLTAIDTFMAGYHATEITLKEIVTVTGCNYYKARRMMIKLCKKRFFEDISKKGYPCEFERTTLTVGPSNKAGILELIAQKIAKNGEK